MIYICVLLLLYTKYVSSYYYIRNIFVLILLHCHTAVVSPHLSLSFSSFPFSSFLFVNLFLLLRRPRPALLVTPKEGQQRSIEVEQHSVSRCRNSVFAIISREITSLAMHIPVERICTCRADFYPRGLVSTLTALRGLVICI